jgi:SAM-dependent methyltransferase
MESERINPRRNPSPAGRLGWIEFLAMNNPARRLVHRHVEFRYFRDVLRAHSIDLTGAVIMDAGCGSGYGTKLIMDEYAPSRMVAFDLMPEQIGLANRRGLGVDFFVGDMTDIDLPDESCGAAFIFGVLHHVPDWRRAAAEVVRTLAPGGVLLVEEPPLGLTWRGLEEELKALGLVVLDSRNLFICAIRAYVCQKPGGVTAAPSARPSAGR